MIVSWIFPISDSTKVTLLVHVLEIVIKAGKHMQIISLSSSSFNMLLAVDGFLTDSIGLGITNLIFSLGGFFFVLQMYKMNRNQHHKPRLTSEAFLDIK